MKAQRPGEVRSVLVYGIETKGLPIPASKVDSKKYLLEFARLAEAPRFQGYDGVILFQGTFESFEKRTGGYRPYLEQTCDVDELDKRTNEAVALVEAGGFLCILLTDPFIDSDDGRDYGDTDLSKRFLNRLDRRNFEARTPVLTSKVEELSKFFRLYGAAWSSLSPRYGDKDCKVLASSGNANVSVVIDGCVFAIPSLLRTAIAEVQEYFPILADGVLSLWERLRDDLPNWAAEYRFPEEVLLLQKRQSLLAEISEIEERLGRFERFKRVLVLQGELLVDAVMELFDALGLKSRREEAFLEDFTLIDSEGAPIAFVEVKGVGKGVTREYINQADSHRERNGRSSDFPSLLVINTNMRNATSLSDKDQRPATEQIQHAARNNILIVRTLDLLNLASLCRSEKLHTAEILDLLMRSSGGWLRVGDTAEVLLH